MDLHPDSPCGPRRFSGPLAYYSPNSPFELTGNDLVEAVGCKLLSQFRDRRRASGAGMQIVRGPQNAAIVANGRG